MFDELLGHCRAFLFLLLAFSANANSWDLAVTIGHQIDFLGQNGTLIKEIQVPEAVTLTGLAYDENLHILYFSDTKGNASMFSLDLTNNDTEPKMLLKRETGSHISGMAYNPESHTLYWTDTIRHLIMQMDVSENKTIMDPVILHRLPQSSPRGIAIDVCNRHLYWTNSNSKNASIQRSNLDGSKKVTVIDTDLYEPIGITIDNELQKIYWVDDEEGITYKIERSNFDGSDREIVVSGNHQQPVFLTTDFDNVYWTDWASEKIWVISKDLKEGDVPKVFKSYGNIDMIRPASLITNRKMKKTECTYIHHLNNIKRKSNTESPEGFAYNVIKDDSKQISEICSNHGFYNETKRICNCQSGFLGTKCEISSCYNYCLEGECEIKKNGLPECQCNGGYEGLRCERNKCDGYCLNDGQCFIENGKPYCRCKYLNTTRCEKSGVDFLEFCAMFCMNGQPALNRTNATLCRCFEKKEALQQTISFNSLLDYNILVPFLGSLICILSITVGALSFYVNKLKRRPRIKKRYVVNRTGVTPLTSMPQVSGEQCEITIENCCNMNICETPCFEPKLRTTIPANVKKDEKNSLLDNMENNLF